MKDFTSLWLKCNLILNRTISVWALTLWYHLTSIVRYFTKIHDKNKIENVQIKCYGAWEGHIDLIGIKKSGYDGFSKKKKKKKLSRYYGKLLWFQVTQSLIIAPNYKYCIVISKLSYVTKKKPTIHSIRKVKISTDIVTIKGRDEVGMHTCTQIHVADKHQRKPKGQSETGNI